MFKTLLKNKFEISFLGILLTFLLFYLLSPFINPIIINVLFSGFLMITLVALTDRPMIFSLSACLLFIALVMNTSTLFYPTQTAEILKLTSSLIFMTVVASVLFHRVFLTKDVKANAIFGAIAVYLLFAMIGALTYALIETLASGSFANLEELNFNTYIYFSLVTQTTLGYGDITPTTSLAKNLATLQAVGGIFYLATLVSSLVNKNGATP